MNETVKKITELETSIKAKEEEAIKHELAAREARSKRNELKGELAELRAILNDAKVVNAIETSAKAAVDARNEADKVLVSLKSKDDSLAKSQEALDGKLKELAELLDGAKKLKDSLEKK